MSSSARLISFRPRARLITILGRDLISDQTIGILELVKNAYDADASQVVVELVDTMDPAATVVTVRDDGCGMTAVDLETKWLSPAVDYKEREKEAQRRTLRGRLPIGEKGVGRFAVHQLGRRLLLVTRAAGASELMVDINWDAFDSGETFLDDLKVTVIERTPEVFTGTNTGTLLQISRTRDVWTAAHVARLQRALRRLQSPHREWRDFTIALHCPDYPQYQGLNTSDILDRAHYVFRGLVDEGGLLDYEYACNLPGIPSRAAADDGCSLVPMAGQELSASAPSCGAFYLNLYVWDRSRDLLSSVGVSREDLDAHSGVSVFRDGLRVLPYGEPGDDWLQLDRERINDPSRRIGNNQVIGYVEVNQEQTVQLRDKTNREGLIDNVAFRDLRALVRAAIGVFTTHWLKDRPRDDAAAGSSRPSRPEPVRLDTALTVAAAIEVSASDSVSVQLPRQLVDRPADGPDADETAAPELVSQRTAARLLVSELDDAAQAVRDHVRAEETQRDILLHLAATGMAAERVVHEFSRQVTAALKAAEELRRLRRLEEGAAQSINVVEACLGTLRNEFRVLAPYHGPARAQRTTSVSLDDAVQLAVRLNQRLIDQRAIQIGVTGEDFSVEARPASIVQVLDNLVNNACLWLGSSASVPRPEIQITLDARQRMVSVADNGPGVPDHAQEHLFEPFFSMRNGGRGLGLYISRELLRPINATIRLAAPVNTATGATFVIEFAAAERRSSARG